MSSSTAIDSTDLFVEPRRSEMQTEVTSLINYQDSVCGGNLCEPFVGQTFESYKDVKDFYYEYASSIGFFLWKGNTKTVDHILVLCRIVCCKEGHSRSLVGSKTTTRCKVQKVSEIRTECDAFLRINHVNYFEEWVIGLVSINHNHPLFTSSK